MPLRDEEIDGWANWELPPGSYVIDFDFDGKKMREGKIWRTLSDKPMRPYKGGFVTLCRRAPSINGFKITKTDRNTVAHVLKRVGKGKPITMTAERMAKHLEKE